MTALVQNEKWLKQVAEYEDECIVSAGKPSFSFDEFMKIADSKFEPKDISIQDTPKEQTDSQKQHLEIDTEDWHFWNSISTSLKDISTQFKTLVTSSNRNFIVGLILSLVLFGIGYITAIVLSNNTEEVIGKNIGSMDSNMSEKFDILTDAVVSSNETNKEIVETNREIIQYFVNIGNNLNQNESSNQSTKINQTAIVISEPEKSFVFIKSENVEKYDELTLILQKSEHFDDSLHKNPIIKISVGNLPQQDDWIEIAGKKITPYNSITLEKNNVTEQGIVKLLGDQIKKISKLDLEKFQFKISFFQTVP